MKRLVLFFLFLIAVAFPDIRSQEADVATLQEQLTSVRGRPRVDILNQLADRLERVQPEEAKAYAEEAYQLSADIQYQRGLILSGYHLGFYERQNGRFRRAERYTETGLEAARAIQDEDLELAGLEQLAGIYQAWKRDKKLEETRLAYNRLKTQLALNQKTNQLDRLRQDYRSNESTLNQVQAEKAEIEESLNLTLEEKLRKEAELARVEKEKTQLELAASELEREAAQRQLEIWEKENQILLYDARLRKQQFQVTLAVVGMLAAFFIILLLVRYNRLKRLRAEERAEAQRQLLVQEKMATLGQLTAGIAHEIKNPLNFVNNFAEGSVELTDELSEVLTQSKATFPSDQFSLIEELTGELKQNAADILAHGQRADRIVRSMMDHARGDTSARQPVPLNDLIKENLFLAYFGFQTQHSDLQVSLQETYDPALQTIPGVPTELSRVFLNIFNNACYALFQKHLEAPSGYTPALSVTTQREQREVIIRIRDNGTGIPTGVRNQIFTPFFTTKPTKEGHTGLGLSISYDIIVQGHDGQLEVESEPGLFTEFIIHLPAN